MAEAIKTKIAEIEAEMAKTQKNKATETHLGILKAKVAKLKKELLEPVGGGGGGGERGFDVNKVGDARVGFVGFPSVGKSTLLTKLTGTESEAAAYEFTTLTAVPGITRYQGARIQMLDLPGIIEGAADGKGRGRQVISTARTSDLILIVLDVLKPITHKLLIEKELEGFGIRLNKTPPKLTFRRKERGGISYVSHVQSPKLTREECIAVRLYKPVCGEYRIHNADIEMRGDHSVDDLVDVIEGNRIYIPCLYILNKIDQITLEELDVIDRMENYVPICAYHEWNLDGVLESVWDKLNLTRVYTKPKGKLPDFNDPVVLKKSKCTVEDFCNRIHKAIMKSFKYALVWGVSSKHRPQRVGKDHVLQDEDIVQIVKKV